MEIDVCAPYSLSRPNRRRRICGKIKKHRHNIPRPITTSFDDRFDSSGIKGEAAEDIPPPTKQKSSFI